MFATIVTPGRYSHNFGQWYFIVSGEMVVVATLSEKES